MSNYTATTTFGSTGNDAAWVTPGFEASAVTVSVAPANGAAFQGIQHALGWTDRTRKMCDSLYFDPATGNAFSGKTTSKLVRLYGDDGSGNMVVVLEATLGTVTGTRVYFNVTTASIDYQVSVKCES